MEMDFIDQGDPKVMSRNEWFKFLKLAFQELVCEYPAFLTCQGIEFAQPADNSAVDCVDRDLLLQTIGMNSDQVPLVPLSEFQQQRAERLISMESIVQVISSYKVADNQEQMDRLNDFEEPKLFTYLNWDDVIDCLLIASERAMRVDRQRDQQEAAEMDLAVQQTKVVLLKDGSALIDMTGLTFGTEVSQVLMRAISPQNFVSIRALSIAGQTLRDVRILDQLESLTLLNLKGALFSTPHFSRLLFPSLQFLNISDVTLGNIEFRQKCLPKIKEIFASNASVSSLGLFAELQTLRLLDLSDNPIESIYPEDLLPNLTVLNLGKEFRVLENVESLHLLSFWHQHRSLRALNPPDIRAVSCFVNFGELAFGKTLEEAPENLADNADTNLINTQETIITTQRQNPHQPMSIMPHMQFDFQAKNTSARTQPLQDQFTLSSSELPYPSERNQSPIASYYEARKASMSVEGLRSMPSTMVCKVALNQQVSPVNAMRIQQPVQSVTPARGRNQLLSPAQRRKSGKNKGKGSLLFHRSVSASRNSHKSLISSSRSNMLSPQLMEHRRRIRQPLESLKCKLEFQQPQQKQSRRTPSFAPNNTTQKENQTQTKKRKPMNDPMEFLQQPVSYRPIPSIDLSDPRKFAIDLRF